MTIDKIKRKNKGTMYRVRFMMNHSQFTSPWLPSKPEVQDWEARKRQEVIDGQVVRFRSLCTA